MVKKFIGEDAALWPQVQKGVTDVRIAACSALENSESMRSKRIVFTNEEGGLRRSVTFVSDLRRKPSAREFLARLVPG
jgi:hypothetical protein